MTKRGKGKGRSRKAPRYLSPDEGKGLKLAAFADLRDLQSRRNHGIVTLLLHGLRNQEVANLEVEHLTLGDRPHLWVRGGKGGVDRRVPLSPEAVSTLLQHLKQQDGTTRELGLVFQGRTGEPLDQSSIWRIVRKLVNRSNIRAPHEIHPHTLRHTFIIACLEKGWNLRLIQRMTGHKSLEELQVYLNYSGKDIDQKAENIGLPF